MQKMQWVLGTLMACEEAFGPADHVKRPLVLQIMWNLTCFTLCVQGRGQPVLFWAMINLGEVVCWVDASNSLATVELALFWLRMSKTGFLWGPVVWQAQNLPAVIPCFLLCCLNSYLIGCVWRSGAELQCSSNSWASDCVWRYSNRAGRKGVLRTSYFWWFPYHHQRCCPKRTRWICCSRKPRVCRRAVVSIEGKACSVQHTVCLS